MITVRGEATGEVIGEIPRSELLHPAATIDEMIGILPSVKKRANGKDRRNDRKGGWHCARGG